MCVASSTTNASVSIESGTLLPEVDQHIRVLAGPGAGKTYWLTEHIRQVVKTSKRLTPCSFIACISYTNVAVEEIRRRLGPANERVEVSTIHSFLYRNLVKPYLHLLKSDTGAPLVNFAAVQRHDEHRPRFNLVEKWIEAENPKLKFKLRGEGYADLVRGLKRLVWGQSPNAGWKVECKQPGIAGFPYNKISKYKPLYWEQGIIDHEDVLYFGYRLLDEFPALRAFLSAKFPYIFIDEFQDTNPKQTAIVRWMAEESLSYVGVIGDPEQAIFAFQGADPLACANFSLPGLKPYIIKGNRRSTNSIITLLNKVRSDGIHQVGTRNVQGNTVQLLIGDEALMLDYAKSTLPSDKSLAVLTRRNDRAVLLRSLPDRGNNQLWQDCAKADKDRAEFLEAIIGAGELVRRGQYTEAFQRTIRALRIRNGVLRDPLHNTMPVTEMDIRALTVALQECVVSEHDAFANEPLLNLYTKLSATATNLRSDLYLTAVKSGKFKDFAASANYSAMCASVALVPIRIIERHGGR